MALNFRKFLEGLRIVPKASDALDHETGDLEVSSGTGKLKYFNNLHPVALEKNSAVVTEDHSAVLKNKTIDTAALNIIKINGNTLSATAGSATVTIPNSTDTLVGKETSDTLKNKTIDTAAPNTIKINGNTLSASAGTATVTIPNSTDTLVGRATSDSLTNKTIDADFNTISNIEDAEIKVGAAISRAKLANGTSSSIVTNNAFGVMSDISLTSGQIILGNSSGVPTATTVSGEVTISSSGVTTVGTMASAVTSGFLKTQMESLAVVSTISPSKTFVRLNSGSGSIDGVTAGDDGRHLILTNTTGSSIILKNQSGAAVAGARIVTGTGGDVSLDSGASLFLIYNFSDSRWYVVGGTGGAPVVNLIAGENLSPNDAVYVSVGATDGGRTAGRAYKLDPTNDSRVEFIGFALDTTTSGTLARIQVGGGLSGLSGLSVGKQVFGSVGIAGGVQATTPSAAGQWVIPVGVATSATTLTINGAGSSTAVKLTSEADPYVYATVRSVSITQSILSGDSIILATGGAGGITLTLPAPVSGKIFNIKKVDAGVGAITINTTSGTIDGAASKTIASQYDSLTITSDGTNFFLI